MSVKQNQDYCLLEYHGSGVWMVELQLAEMVQDYINTYGNELADRQKFQTCAQYKIHEFKFTVALDTRATACACHAT
jgi:hypothetical protein